MTAWQQPSKESYTRFQIHFSVRPACISRTRCSFVENEHRLSGTAPERHSYDDDLSVRYFQSGILSI